MWYSYCMKTLLSHFLINFVSLYGTTTLVPGLTYSGGIVSLAFGAFVFMLINFFMVPLLKLLFLPLNILTIGLFAWVINVISLYALTTLVSDFALVPYFFPGADILGVNIPPTDLSTFWVAVVASFLIGLITHFFHWLAH